MKCRRLIGEAGQDCATCGRRIVRYEGARPGNYSLQHEGTTIAQKLAALRGRAA